MSFEQLATDAVVARFLVHVILEKLLGEYSVTGRVVGPKCPGISTVEIAYPLSVVEVAEKYVRLSGVIPEPNLWTPETPFHYRVSVEVWEQDRCVETQLVNLVLRGHSNENF